MKYPLGVGEGRVKFLKLWKEALDENPEFKSFAVANAPGVAATGLRIAMELLQGKELKDTSLSGQFGTTVIVPVPVTVDPDNFDEVYAEYVDGGYPRFLPPGWHYDHRRSTGFVQIVCYPNQVLWRSLAREPFFIL